MLGENKIARAVHRMETRPWLSREIRKIQHYYADFIGRPEPTDLDVYSWLQQVGNETDLVLASIDEAIAKNGKMPAVRHGIYTRRNALVPKDKKMDRPGLVWIIRAAQYMRWHRREALERDDKATHALDSETIRTLDRLASALRREFWLQNKRQRAEHKRTMCREEQEKVYETYNKLAA